MRLPLGILTGVGFIGGGTILKKGELVTGGDDRSDPVADDGDRTLLRQWRIDARCDRHAARGFHPVDAQMGRSRNSSRHRARLVVTCEASWNVLAELPQIVEPMKFTRGFSGRNIIPIPGETDYAFELSWRRPERAIPPLEAVSCPGAPLHGQILRTHDRHGR